MAHGQRIRNHWPVADRYRAIYSSCRLSKSVISGNASIRCQLSAPLEMVKEVDFFNHVLREKFYSRRAIIRKAIRAPQGLESELGVNGLLDGGGFWHP